MSQWFHDIPKTLTQEKPGRRQALKTIGGLRFLLVVLLSALALAPQIGHIRPVVAAPLSSYAFTVNTTLDTHDAHPGDGKCADSMGHCSLRAATEEADALPVGSSITITVPAGTYPLTLGTLQLTGTRSITIHGAGRTATILNGNHTFGIMSIASPRMSALLSQLTIEGGSALNGGSGGGIDNEGGILTVTNSTLSGNSATGSYGGGGGGIYNTGTLTVTNSTFRGNSATGTLGYGAFRGRFIKSKREGKGKGGEKSTRASHVTTIPLSL